MERVGRGKAERCGHEHAGKLGQLRFSTHQLPCRLSYHLHGLSRANKAPNISTCMHPVSSFWVFQSLSNPDSYHGLESIPWVSQQQPLTVACMYL